MASHVSKQEQSSSEDKEKENWKQDFFNSVPQTHEQPIPAKINVKIGVSPNFWAPNPLSFPKHWRPWGKPAP
jgi:hypothetical protein